MYLLTVLHDWWLGKPRSPEGRDPMWAELARHVIAEVGCCECCRTKENLEAHHKYPYHLFPALEMVRDNIKVLCRRCHFMIGHLDDWKSYNRNVDSDCAWLESEFRNRPFGRRVSR